MSGFGTTSGFSFGNTPQTTANTQATGFSFGAKPTLQAAPTNFSFGNAPTTATTNFNFPAVTTTPTLQFGQTATTTTTAAPAAPSFSFGLPSAAAAPTTTATVPTLGGTGLGGTSFSFGKTTATTSAGLNFNTTTTAATTATAFSGFNPPAAKTNTTGGGIGGWIAPTPVVTATTTTASTTPFVGLGGVDITSTQPKTGDSKQDNVKVKETPVPDEIAKTVDALKEHIKKQKSMSSDIGRTSTSKLSNVTGEILNLQWLLREISNSVEANYHQIKRLRKETSRTIQTVEMAQRTQDTPAGLQYENIAPFQFFQNLVQKYESDLIDFRQQIALTEKHMQSLTSPQIVTPEDLKRGFQQINESFISLAGRLHEIHQKVEAQKEQYLNLRKYRLHDTTNVFAKLESSEVEPTAQSKVTSGPTPFSSISGMSAFGKTMATTSGGASGASGSQTGK